MGTKSSFAAVFSVNQKKHPFFLVGSNSLQGKTETPDSEATTRKRVDAAPRFPRYAQF
jgi:hypothetical protein